MEISNSDFRTWNEFLVYREQKRSEPQKYFIDAAEKMQSHTLGLTTILLPKT
jgi:hypothetical protein